MFQIGYIGLLKAVERFDPNLGNAFSSFAVPYIQGEIQHSLRNDWGAIKVPRRILETAAKVRRVKRKLEALGATVDEKSVATALQIGENDWQQITQAVTGSLVAPLNDSHYQIAVGPNEPRYEPPTIPREQLYKQLYSLPPLQSAIVQEALFGAGSCTTFVAPRADD